VRLRILGGVASYLATIPDINLIHVCFDKQNLKVATTDIFDLTWTTLLQRFHNTMSHRKFPGPRNAEDKGLIVTDATDGEKLRRLTRRLGQFNAVPNQPQHGPGYRQLPIDTLVEDPVPRDSRHSYFLQCCDVAAYLLTQKLKPNSLFRRRKAQDYFDRLNPVLCKVASSTDPQGIVKL
jgi:hypothetical protein